MAQYKSEIKQRLDKFLTSVLPIFSRAKIQKMVGGGKVLVNGKKVKVGFMLRNSDLVDVVDLPKKKLSLKAEKMDLKVLYEDDACIVLNKPAGMVVHPDQGGRYMTGTVANFALSKVTEEVGDKLRPGIVHRIDRDTSGVLVIAKTAAAFRMLQDQFRERNVGKVYLALVRGSLKYKQGVIDSPIARDDANKRRMWVSAKGREAISSYKVLDEFDGVSLLEVSIHTGRTHQIRVHMAAIGHPVVGDVVYGDKRLNELFLKDYALGRQFLHAWKVSFKSPDTGKKITVKAEVPSDLNSVITQLSS